MRDQLCQALRRRTNHRGLVIAREGALLEELRTTAQELRSAVLELERDRLVEIRAPLPFLVLKWSGSKPTSGEIGPKTGPEATRADSFQSSLSQSKQMKESYRHPDGDETLLQEILDTLGETDPTTFRGAIRCYPPDVVRTALERIRRMPTIRKNPTALFRYLLPRIAQEPRFKN